jgi:hypothetical protein
MLNVVQLDLYSQAHHFDILLKTGICILSLLESKVDYYTFKDILVS